MEVTADNGGGPHRPSQSLPVPLGPMDATLPPPPVMEAGEAGPPGKMTATSKLPKGVDGSMMPVKGFAGAPGEEFTHGRRGGGVFILKHIYHVLFCSTSQCQIYRLDKDQHGRGSR